MPGASRVVLVVLNLPAKAGDVRDAGSTPGSGRSPGGGNVNPLQDSCLESPMDRGVWWATVHRAIKNRTWPNRLSRHVPCVRHGSKHLTSIQSRNPHNNPIGIIYYHYFIDEATEVEKLSDLLPTPQLVGAQLGFEPGQSDLKICSFEWLHCRCMHLLWN